MIRRKPGVVPVVEFNGNESLAGFWARLYPREMRRFLPDP
jgi:hypothetical protein